MCSAEPEGREELVHWCHGAPGVAMTMAKAYQVRTCVCGGGAATAFVLSFHGVATAGFSSSAGAQVPRAVRCALRSPSLFYCRSLASGATWPPRYRRGSLCGSAACSQRGPASATVLQVRAAERARVLHELHVCSLVCACDRDNRRPASAVALQVLKQQPKTRAHLLPFAHTRTRLTELDAWPSLRIKTMHAHAGNAYALLAVWRATGDAAWHARAQRFALFMTEPGEGGGRGDWQAPDHPWSLFEGLGGALCLLSDLVVDPEVARMPFYEI